MGQQALCPDGGRSPMVGTRLLAEDAQRLDQLAKRHRVTRAALVRQLIRQALAAEQQDTGPPGR
jgi:predicted transcriptional regulator